jgi:hypothetical protein
MRFLLVIAILGIILIGIFQGPFFDAALAAVQGM